MSRVYVFLAEGFEEIEGLTVVDLLRRAKIGTETVSVTGKKEVTGAHGITVTADCLFEERDFKEAEALVLPGGMPGTKNLGEHPGLAGLLSAHYAEEKIIAAICAAPSVLGQMGFLQGRVAVCYPGFESMLEGAVVCSAKVAVDGNVVTSRGMGTAIDFSLKLIELLENKELSEEISGAVLHSAF